MTTCESVARLRSTLERARDIRTQSDANLLAFNVVLSTFLHARETHRVETGCKEFH